MFKDFSLPAWLQEFDFGWLLNNYYLYLQIPIVIILIALFFVERWFHRIPISIKPKPHIGRDEQVHEFNDTIKATENRIWSIFGEGGIGKSYLLNNFRDICRQEKIACIKHDWEKYQDTEINALDYWLETIMLSGEEARSHFAKHPQQQPIFFSMLAFYHSRKGTKVWSSKVKKIVALLFAPLPVVYFIIQSLKDSNLERELLFCLYRHLDKNRLVYLIDNHELARTKIKTQVKLSDNQLISQKSAIEISLIDYLEKIVIPFLNFETKGFVLITTGWRPLALVPSLTYSVNRQELKNLSAEDVEKIIQQNIPDDPELTPEIIQQIVSLTLGNPLLITYTISLIKGKESTDSLETLFEQFQYHDKGSYHHYVMEQLAKRILAQYKEQVSTDTLWRLAVPYRLNDKPALETLLFQENIFKKFAKLGLLHKVSSDNNIYHLHTSSKATLRVFEYERYVEKRDELHKKLADDFFKEGEAHCYHQLCAMARRRLEYYHLTPEDYWQLLDDRFDINDEDRSAWKLESCLPKSKDKLKLRIERLQADGDLLAGLCGDAQSFLVGKFRSADHSIRLSDLNNLESVNALLKEVAHLSDLHYLKGRASKDQLVKIEAFSEAIRLNPTHLWAHYYRALVNLQDARLEAVDDLQQALGIKGWQGDYVQAHLDWMGVKHETAKAKFKQILQIFEAKKGAKEDADLWRVQGDLAILECWPLNADKALDVVDEVSTTKATAISHVIKPTSSTDVIEIETPKPKSKEKSHNLKDALAKKRESKLLKQYQKEIKECNKTLKSKPDDYRALNNRGVAYEKLGEYIKAIESYDQAIKSQSHCYEARNNKGYVFLKLERYEEALAFFNKALEIKPNDDKVWHNKGCALDKLERYEEALEALNKAIEIKHDYYQAWRNKSVTLGKLERYEEALKSFNKVLAIKPNDDDDWYNKGCVLEKLERYEEALEALNKAIEIKHDYYQAWYYKGVTLAELDQYEEALTSYNNALEFKKDYFEAWNGRGDSLSNLGKYQGAKQAYKQALKIQPDSYEALSSLGIVFINLKQYQEALDSFNQVIEIKADYYNAWSNRGLALIHHLKQYEEAVESCNQALKIESNDYRAWFIRGLALIHLGKFQLAASCYDQAFKTRADFPQDLHNLALFYQQANNPTQAEHYFAIEKDLTAVLAKQATAEQYINIAKQVYGAYQHWQSAWRCLFAALKRTDHKKAVKADNLPLYCYAAELLIILGKRKRAEVYIQWVKKCNPETPELLYLFARLHQANKDSDKAQQTLQQYYDHHQHSLDFQKLLTTAQFFRELNNSDYALKVCSAAINKKPEANWTADYLYAKILWKNADQAIEAAEEFAKLLTHKTPHPKIYFADAQLALAQGDLQRAKKHLKILKNKPEISQKKQQPWRNLCAKMLYKIRSSY